VKRRLAQLLGALWLPAAVLQAPAAWAAQACTPEAKPRSVVRTAPVALTGPVQLWARELRSQIEQETQATGEVELHRGGLTLTAETLRYLNAQQQAIAQGKVHVERGADVFDGTEASINLNDQSGSVLQPQFTLGRNGASGLASRMDFSGSRSFQADGAEYTSCVRQPGQEPDWVLSMDHLSLDFERNEGRADGAVLRFLGAPILVLPVLSFPVTEEPKSGWLPPSLNIDTSAGIVISEPYYWRIAPNLDALFAPEIATKRGTGVRGDFRYLLPSDEGRLEYHVLPDDQMVGGQRYSLFAEHDGAWGDAGRYGWSAQLASDDSYWKDFSHYLPSLTPRLLPQQAWASQRWALSEATEVQTYARVQSWQVLQDSTALITPPYQRLPQLGMRLNTQGWQGLRYELETEANHFQLGDLPSGVTPSLTLPQEGARLHAVQALYLPLDSGWGWLTPRLALNSAAYHYSYTKLSEDSSSLDDGVQIGQTMSRNASRSIPTFSLDMGLRFERDAAPFGKDLVQTLEPRLHYVRTPRRSHQADLPLFDTAGSDFNAVSIYADNAFSGVDRVSDANQLTLGATSRLLSADNGVERLRFGMAQRFLFREQELTTDGSNGSSGGKFSDLLLFGSGQINEQWHMDSTVQYNVDIKRPVRTIASLSYQPGPFQTLSGTYRYTRDLSEQVELGWQWPLYRSDSPRAGGNCHGVFYGVGRAVYSMRDNRLTDTLLGMEYDAGCWIVRAVAQKVSTSSSESTTHFMLQLELVGLSRLGSNPLQTLKDNIPGYRLLRDENNP